jgi:hypothetical protein
VLQFQPNSIRLGRESHVTLWAPSDWSVVRQKEELRFRVVFDPRGQCTKLYGHNFPFFILVQFDFFTIFQVFQVTTLRLFLKIFKHLNILNLHVSELFGRK